MSRAPLPWLNPFSSNFLYINFVCFIDVCVCFMIWDKSIHSAKSVIFGSVWVPTHGKSCVHFALEVLNFSVFWLWTLVRLLVPLSIIKHFEHLFSSQSSKLSNVELARLALDQLSWKQLIDWVQLAIKLHVAKNNRCGSQLNSKAPPSNHIHGKGYQANQNAELLFCQSPRLTMKLLRWY